MWYVIAAIAYFIFGAIFAGFLGAHATKPVERSTLINIMTFWPIFVFLGLGSALGEAAKEAKEAKAAKDKPKE